MSKTIKVTSHMIEIWNYEDDFEGLDGYRLASTDIVNDRDGDSWVVCFWEPDHSLLDVAITNVAMNATGRT